MQELGDGPGKRLLVVANRLPFGWPGTDIHKNDQGDVARELDKQYNSVPIFLSKEAVKNYYNGFSNSVLWPLLHSLHFRVQFSHTWARAYREVNKYFTDTIIPYIQDGDRIWVHDYHLILLPRLLRDRLQDRKNVRIGLFLHTPFPASDAFDIMPMREEICDGLLSCDLAGFHIREYVDNFLDCASGVLSGVKRSPSDLHYLDRKLIAHEFPLGIDPAEYKKSIACDATQTELGRLQDVFRGKKVILGVDRLDYTKGLPQELHAYDRMLSENPEWIGKVQMVQLCVPTRSTVEEYKIPRHEVESLVGRINGTHGTLTWTPVQYLHRTLDPDVLHALYAIADICIVSAIRDGLNLVCFEYVASQLSRYGVLMLSQYTGAARLFDTAVEFNPWDTPKFANAIAQALDMP
ncbi:hypothetical protein MY3296_007619 [Beauveria thailandica]